MSVGVVTLAGPTITPAWVAALDEAVDACGDPAVRAVLVWAAGRDFCVGADLAHLVAHRDRLDDELHAMVEPYHEALAALHALDVPVVCAAQGVIAGGAIGLLCAADVVLFADDARVVPGFAAVGLGVDGGSTWALPRLVGTRRAWELLGEGRTLAATDAVDWGLASEVVARAELDATARARAAALATGPTRALGAIRRLLRADGDVEAALVAELAAQTRLGRTADARAGVGAFVEHRRPVFEGR